MSELLKRIKEDLKNAMLGEVEYRKMGITSGADFSTIQDQKTVSRAIISMFPEIGVKPNKATDEDTTKLLKKYISQEKTRELYQQGHLGEKDVAGLNGSQLNTLVMTKFHELGDSLTSIKIEIARSYLPKQASEEDVIKYINENIDMTKFRNKMQAMGILVKAFPGCDGSFLKGVLQKV